MVRLQKILVVLLLVVLIGCTAFVSRKAAVSGKKIEYSVYGKGQPVVVFMSGLGNTMDIWRDVYWHVGKLTTSLMYNRFGYGASSKTKMARTGGHIVNELREFLQAAGYSPPYTLVAHSVAGLYTVYYAKTYPDEICGMVLVDSSHWDQKKYLEGQEDTFFSSLFSAVSKVLLLFIDTGMSDEEFAGIDETSRQIQMSGEFSDIPLIVLTGSHHFPFGNPISEEQWQKWQKELADLSPQGKQIVARRSGHFIQKSEPKLVVNAIKEVLEAW
jgi:pimeloyl-ACP methyl ester carboxylesterase